ncbi:MAG: glycosyltransferase [Prochlorococcaceae cyanobacterium]
MITGVLTSCERHDLLVKTLRSFYAVNTFPLDKMIVVEDGLSIPESVRSEFRNYPVEWISTGERVGQIAAIDYAYSRVVTPYIFHLEDDWEFYRGGFIEKSLVILRSQPKCLQVWIRALDDLMGHPVLPYDFKDDGVEWKRLAYDYKKYWHGFSFNPGLRRMRDYVAINGYGGHGRFDSNDPQNTEENLCRVYRQRDFFAAVLSDEEGSGYVRHSGDDRHIGGWGHDEQPPSLPRRAWRKLIRIAQATAGR